MHKVTLVVAELKKLLKPMGGLINSNTVLPILEDILFEFEEGKLKLSVTDLETIITTNLSVTGTKEPFKFCVNFSQFKQLVDRCESENITLEYKGSRFLKISSSEPEFTVSIVIEDADQYPKAPELKDIEVERVFEAKHILPQLLMCSRFVSHDDLRPSMTGVLFTFAEMLTLVATDAHRLCKKTIPLDNVISNKELKYIVPAKGVKMILQLFKEGPLKFKVSPNHTQIVTDDHTITIRNIDARFPDWTTVWPKELPSSFMCKRKQMQSMLLLSMPFSNRSTDQIVFDIKNDIMMALAQDVDFSTEFSYKLPIYDCRLNEMQIALNSKFLFEALRLSKDDATKIQYYSPTKALIIDNDILIMPLMLNQ